ncbi:MAG: AAA family ATPase [Bacteroidales bacterium]
MENLINKSHRKVQSSNVTFKRFLIDEIHWEDRLIGIKGARGVGKTTMLLQYIKEYLPTGSSPLYVSLDDLYFSSNRLYDLAEEFIKYGGTHLFLDEVHRYPDWAPEIKLIYDDFPELKVVFTGSSILEISNARADLSRRAIVYILPGLSFREYLNFMGNAFEKIELQDILLNHEQIAAKISYEQKILPKFNEYLEWGYYPFFREYKTNFADRLREVVNLILDYDLMMVKKIPVDALIKLKKLLYILCNSVPFKPNISKLSEVTGISRNTLVNYLNVLEESAILNLLHTDSSGIGYLRKPEKVYLENTNLIYALSQEKPETGTIRESFFLNQLRIQHQVVFKNKGDFFVDNKYLFEVGGRSKSQKQIAGEPDSYIAADGIEVGFKNKIPLWLFGFMY